MLFNLITFFTLAQNSKKEQNHFLESTLHSKRRCLGEWFGTFFEDLNQSERLSEIKPPLSHPIVPYFLLYIHLCKCTYELSYSFLYLGEIHVTIACKYIDTYMVRSRWQYLHILPWVEMSLARRPTVHLKKSLINPNLTTLESLLWYVYACKHIACSRVSHNGESSPTMKLV